MEIKELDFKDDLDHGSDYMVAETPIGKYYIEKCEEFYETFSDIEEIGADKTLSGAKDRANEHHKRIIGGCYE